MRALKRKGYCAALREGELDPVKHCAIVAAASIALFGCVNNYARFYTPVVRNPSVGLREYSGYSRVSEVQNVSSHSATLLRSGYHQLGWSAFRAGGYNPESQLAKQAKAIGADIVVYSRLFAGTHQTVYPLLQFQPGTTSTANIQGTANISSYGRNGEAAYSQANISGTATTTTAGTYSTQMVPISIDRYDFEATYWRKGVDPILGVMATALPDDLRRDLKRNTGAVVTIVVDNSPAFTANIVPGDVLVGLGNEAINSAEDLTFKLPRLAGTSVVASIIRDRREIKVPVTLNAALK